MTMEEIDRLRTELGIARDRVNKLQEQPMTFAALEDALYKEACAERNVLDALQKWWEQGCKNV